jgi:hypothetical protein
MEDCKFFLPRNALRPPLTHNVQYIIFAIFNFAFIPIIYFFLVETRKRSLEELDVIFAAGGNPVKKEQSMPHDISVDESRRVLGLGEHTEVSEILEHDAKQMEKLGA